MRLTRRRLRFPRRFHFDDLILLAAWMLLAAVGILGTARILRPWLTPTLDWLKLTIALAGFFIATELTFRFLLRKHHRAIALDAEGNFRMEPHIFTHFMPSSQNKDISEDRFRVTGTGWPAGVRDSRPILYLAGDCTLFEEHLPTEETFAHQLQLLLPQFRVLNVGTDHYTALHSYSRFAIDLLRGHRPAVVFLCTAANDVLSFIHHKEGVVRPDHSHMYKPWLSYAQVLERVSRVPTATLKFLLLRSLYGSSPPTWDTLAEEISPEFQDPKNTAVARRLFNPAWFLNVLELLEAACRSAGSTLVLSTYAYQPWDMIEEPRRTYAWGIDRLNEEIREVARRRSIPLVDLADEMVVEGNDILNKWHYTLSGNRKRARIAARHLRALEALLPEGVSHAAS